MPNEILIQRDQAAVPSEEVLVRYPNISCVDTPDFRPSTTYTKPRAETSLVMDVICCRACPECCLSKITSVYP